MELAFREYGKGEPILILHGLFGQSDNWNSLAKQFSEQGYRVLAADLRNHGLSPHSEEWDYASMAGDVKELIEKHHLHQPILLGHSMGGKVLLFFERLFPGIAAKLIIADIAARYYAPHHQSIIQALKSVDFAEVRSRKDAEAILLASIPDFGTRQFLLKNLYWKTTGGLDWRFNLKVISEKIGKIGEEVPPFHSNCPVLVLRGERSDYILESDILDFQTRFSVLQVQTIAGAGHWLHAEQPQKFFETVMKFITA